MPPIHVGLQLAVMACQSFGGIDTGVQRNGSSQDTYPTGLLFIH